MIELKVKQVEKQRLVTLGAQLLQDGKTWVIPDGIMNINAFSRWLPQNDGIIVQRPYFVLRAKCQCWKCKKETTVVALGAKCYQMARFNGSDLPVWDRVEATPMIFCEITYLDKRISGVMQENYPFFRQVYVKKMRHKEWCNCCVHCGVAQEDDDDWRYDGRNPWSPLDMEQAKELRVIYFGLEFDYYVLGCYQFSDIYLDFLL